MVKTAGDTVVELIADRWLAENNDQFVNDKDKDMLKLFQLLNPTLKTVLKKLFIY